MRKLPRLVCARGHLRLWASPFFVCLLIAACTPAKPPPPPLAGGDILYSNASVLAHDFNQNVCGGQTLFSGATPAWEWTPIQAPTDELSGNVTMSGTVVVTKYSGRDQNNDPNDYTQDVPFTHPFYNDYEWFVAADPKFDALLAPSNKPGTKDHEYIDAIAASDARNLKASGVLGMETDRNLYPAEYRPQAGDRMVALGRWITDCGHDDFHSELHPPLVMAIGGPVAGKTAVKVISNPFLVGQEFFNSCTGHLADCGQPGCDKSTGLCDDGGVLVHLENELKRIAGDQRACHYAIDYHVLCSLSVEAHPTLHSPPFEQQEVTGFVVAPPANTKSPQATQLTVAYHLVVRSGVKVVIIKNPDINNPDSVEVQIVMNADEYKAAAPPARHDDNGSVLDVISAETTTAKKTFEDLIKQDLGGLKLDIAAQFAHTVATDRYDSVKAPAVASCATGPAVSASQLPKATNLTIDDNQPFPIVGCISVYWSRPVGPTVPPLVKRTPVPTTQ